MPAPQDYNTFKEACIRYERDMLKSLGFITHVEHPHKLLLNYCQVMKVDKAAPELVQEAWSVANDRCVAIEATYGVVSPVHECCTSVMQGCQSSYCLRRVCEHWTSRSPAVLLSCCQGKSSWRRTCVGSSVTPVSVARGAKCRIYELFHMYLPRDCMC